MASPYFFGPNADWTGQEFSDGLKSAVTTNELRRRYPNASEAFIKRNAKDSSDHQASSPKPQCTVCDDALGTAARKEENSSRVRVRVISFRRRLIDPDNLAPKWHIDCLRYCGYIRDDRDQDIVLEVSQEKVASKAQEHTRIEIEPIVSPIALPPLKSSEPSDRANLIELYWDQCGSAWNRPAFDVFMETLSDDDLLRYITHGSP